MSWSWISCSCVARSKRPGCKEDGADGYMVQHIQAPREADELAARGVEIFGHGPLLISEIGPVIGTHVGPGLIGAGAIPTAYL